MVSSGKRPINSDKERGPCGGEMVQTRQKDASCCEPGLGFLPDLSFTVSQELSATISRASKRVGVGVTVWYLQLQGIGGIVLVSALHCALPVHSY
ncbi:hypothetical protein VNO77_17220 [Canavalia gladiata]|uniref:Uncharacterized protein n=1 Tax=Canavalia gladiata TaxID=3824 RepID=A0AAN9LIN7_CANGL